LLYNPWARRKGMGDLTNPKVKKIERNWKYKGVVLLFCLSLWPGWLTKWQGKCREMRQWSAIS
jgi:hypothetical protein